MPDPLNETLSAARIPTVRSAAPPATAQQKLGLLADLVGTWEGTGFNLIARPDRQGGSPLFLELNQTFEVLSFVPISSPIPNRGSAVNDIELAGLTYLQKVTDLVTQGALHIEPGIWITPAAGAEVPTRQTVSRMGTIPHGNSLLAEGLAIQVASLVGNTFDPTLTSSTTTAPFPVGGPMPAQGTRGGFPEYTLANATNFRTLPADVPASILGVGLQQLIDNPTLLLKAALAGQNVQSMAVLNVATVDTLMQTQPGGAPAKDILAGFGAAGGLANIPFLQANANAEVMFATFWIENIKGADGSLFQQLQYVQTVFLNFPVITPGAAAAGPVLTWPHVSVATLRKTFGGQ